jgi:hypothetical protein
VLRHYILIGTIEVYTLVITKKRLRDRVGRLNYLLERPRSLYIILLERRIEYITFKVKLIGITITTLIDYRAN